MRICALIARLYGDIAHQPLALGLLMAVVCVLSVLSAVGVVELLNRAEDRVRARLDTREPGRALADDDRDQWREAEPEPEPLAAQIATVLAIAETDCRQAAQQREA